MNIIAVLFILIFSQYRGLCHGFYNVGTTLFKKSNADQVCWSKDEKDLLIARRIVQDLLPKPDMIDFQDPAAFSTLIEYFRMGFNVIKSGSNGKTQKNLMMAFADAVGGYLKCYILPLIKLAYYSGHASYDDTETMHELYSDLRIFLKTTGAAWFSNNQSFHHTFLIHGLDVKSEVEPDACQDLLLNDHEPVVHIPLPVLDDENEPTAMATPLRNSTFVSLKSNKSVNILPIYYMSTLKCMVAKSRSKNSIVEFNSALYKWIDDKIVPHLKREDWFPGFRGVYQVIETLKALGIDPRFPQSSSKLEFDFVETVPAEESAGPDEAEEYLRHVVDIISDHDHPRQNLTAVYVLMGIFIIVTLGCCCCCIKKKWRDSKFLDSEQCTLLSKIPGRRAPDQNGSDASRPQLLKTASCSPSKTSMESKKSKRFQLYEDDDMSNIHQLFFEPSLMKKEEIDQIKSDIAKIEDDDWGSLKFSLSRGTKSKSGGILDRSSSSFLNEMAGSTWEYDSSLSPGSSHTSDDVPKFLNKKS